MQEMLSFFWLFTVLLISHSLLLLEANPGQSQIDCFLNCKAEGGVLAFVR